MLGGVARGLAEYFDTDPILIRIIFVVTFFMGCGLLAYVILWIVVPKEPLVIFNPDATAGQKSTGEPAGQDPQPVYEPGLNKRGSGCGIVLIVIGILFLLHNFFPVYHFWHFRHFWPLLLVVIGASLIMRSRNN
jgi:phage shock protein PspC (stress-responsive transcriptional regulator)